jgi:hypothetical protein
MEIATREIEQFQKEIAPQVTLSRELTITALTDLEVAVGHTQNFKAMRERIDSTFGPLVEAAHRQHKAILATMRTFTDPLDEAEEVVKEKIGQYVLEHPGAKVKGLTVRLDEVPVIEEKTLLAICKEVAKGKLPPKLLKLDVKVLKDLLKAGIPVPVMSEARPVVSIRQE